MKETVPYKSRYWRAYMMGVFFVFILYLVLFEKTEAAALEGLRTLLMVAPLN